MDGDGDRGYDTGVGASFGSCMRLHPIHLNIGLVLLLLLLLYKSRSANFQMSRVIVCVCVLIACSTFRESTEYVPIVHIARRPQILFVGSKRNDKHFKS